eukprot:46340-Hanusia_phi.AAC.3
MMNYTRVGGVGQPRTPRGGSLEDNIGGRGGMYCDPWVSLEKVRGMGGGSRNAPRGWVLPWSEKGVGPNRVLNRREYRRLQHRFSRYFVGYAW